MSRSLLAAAGAFTVMALVTMALLRRPQEAERAAARARPVPRLGPGDFDTLEVRKSPAPETWTTIRRQGPHVRVIAPVDYPADPAGGTAAFAAIEKLDFLDLVTDRPARHAELEVDDGKGVRVGVKKGDRLLIDLVIGKTVDDYGTLVRLPGHAEVWQVAGAIRETFAKGPSDWRDRAVTLFEPRDVERAEIATGDGQKLALRKTGTKTYNRDDWAVISSTVPIDRLDPNAPNKLVETMSSLKASTFADGVKAADVGLDPPALSVTVGLKGWPPVTLFVGNAGGDDEFYVRNPEMPQIFLVKRFNIDRVGRRPIQFRDKTLCDISEADVIEFGVDNGNDSFTVVKHDGVWTATRPRALAIDQEKIVSLSNVFRVWAADEIVEKPTSVGVNAVPRIVIVGRSRKASCRIFVDGESNDHRNYFVRTSTGREQLYVIPKWMVERIVLPITSLGKKV